MNMSSENELTPLIIPEVYHWNTSLLSEVRLGREINDEDLIEQ